MAFKITTDLAALDSTASIKAKISAIIDAWKGAGTAAAATTWGQWRTHLNDIATAAGKSTFANNELFSSFFPKINVLNDAEQVIAGFGGVAWWNADRADLIALSGSQVTSWTDSIGAKAAAQATASLRPLYSATDFGGSSGIIFDGADDFLSFTPTGFPSGAAPGDLWVVGRDDGNDANTRRFFAYGDTGNNNTRFMAGTGVLPSRNVNMNTGTGAAVAVTPLTYTTGVRSLLRGKVTATMVGVEANGAAGTDAAAVSTTVLTIGRIGIGTNGSGPLQGALRDVFIFNTVLAGNALTYFKNYANGRRN